MSIKLAARTDGGYHRFDLSFATEDQAIAYAAARSSTHIIAEREDAPLDPSLTKLLDYLYPTCHHGMDAGLCGDPYGPNHFGTREWEQSMGW